MHIHVKIIALETSEFVFFALFIGLIFAGSEDVVDVGQVEQMLGGC